MFSKSISQLHFPLYIRSGVKYLGLLPILLLFYANSMAHAAPSALLKKEYEGFTLWLDCNTRHGAVAFYYKIGRDKANVRKKNINFDFDRKVSVNCQPQTWRTYNTTTVDAAQGTWTRGKLVPSNHMDGNLSTFKETYYLTNTLPQNSVLSQSEGAWRHTEIITECYRDITPLEIWGGVIWGNNTDNDFFTVTHGIKTPDFWWKLIYRHDKKTYNAWIFPNHWSAKASKIDDFLISIEKLKKAVAFMPDIGALENTSKAGIAPKYSWPVEISEGNLQCEGKTTSSE